MLNKTTLRSLMIIQFLILIAIYIHARTSLLWLWSVLSFLPALIICLYTDKRRYVLLSLSILFISQQALFVFANPSWGFSYGSDQINDFHTASVIYQCTHFELGQASYASRLSYSYYPMLHLFSVMFSKVSGVPLMSVALFIIPFSSAVLTTVSLFLLNCEFFGLSGRARNLAVLFFGMSFYYTLFQSQFTRETFAFPLVLLAIWIFARITKSQHQACAIIASILIGAIIFSHQMSSYLFFIVSIIMIAGFNIFHRNGKLNHFLFLTATMLGAYTMFVVLSFSVTQWTYAFEGIQAILHREGPIAIMRPYPIFQKYLSISQYAILGILATIGGFKLLRERNRDWTVLTLIGFFLLAFIVSTILRLSTPADPWSYTYYMSLRGTIWAFIGISVTVAIGIAYILELKNVNKIKFIALVIIICVLGLGKFSQYPTLVVDPTDAPVVYSQYVATLWLKTETIHGSNILVAPYKSDMDAFDTSRCMAPYAYLKEYFLDETEWRSYEKFNGYIPFVGSFFDQYKNLPNVQIIYSNGDTDIGYKSE